jgi:2-(1,2-epoxy-1,2-dihydrophenyl)acetyl-CoA isomerase
MSAEEALDYGLVSKVLPVDELMLQMHNLAHELAKGPTQAYGLIKRAFSHVVHDQLAQTLHYEAYLQEIAGRTEDHREGAKAFTEKRPPKFRGS